MRHVSLPRLLLALSSICALAVPVEVQLLDAAGKPLGEVVVYAEPLSAKAPKGKLSHIIDQVDKEFVPLVNVVQVGTAVSFPNKDNIRHNIYSFSPPQALRPQALFGHTLLACGVRQAGPGGAGLQYPRLDGQLSADRRYPLVRQDGRPWHGQAGRVTSR